MRQVLAILALLFTATVAWAVSYPPAQAPSVHEEFTSVEAFRFRDVQGTSLPPAIPKSWKLIGASNGEKSNSNNLWFQDTDGSVYLLQGFTSNNKFYIHENVHKIPAK